MNSVLGKGILLVCAVLLIAGVQPAGAGVPEVVNHFVTDVTTVSFSVIWAASEPCTADIEVFDDESGTTPAASAVISEHPVNSGDALIRTAAEDKGRHGNLLSLCNSSQVASRLIWTNDNWIMEVLVEYDDQNHHSNDCYPSDHYKYWDGETGCR